MTAEQAKQIQPWQEAMGHAKGRFIEIATQDEIVDWQRESMFALQAIEKNDYLRKIANENPNSLRNAIINVAAIGVTLNPAAQYAALVPRDGVVCLDIMYRGLIKIATDAGSIRWVQADLVHEKDEFTYAGKVGAPTHKANVFAADRGPVIGVYCVARTADGDTLTEVMSVDEINAIRDRSDYWKKKKAGPWATDWGEMAKKTIIKRARKTWPETDARSSERLQTATEIANLTDGYEALEHKPEPNGKILPTEGAWDSLNEETKQKVHKTAEAMKKRLVAYDIPGAVALMDGAGFDSEAQVALWTLFDSRARTAMTKFMRESKPAIEGSDLDKQAVAAMERDAA